MNKWAMEWVNVQEKLMSHPPSHDAVKFKLIRGLGGEPVWGSSYKRNPAHDSASSICDNPPLITKEETMHATLV